VSIEDDFDFFALGGAIAPRHSAHPAHRASVPRKHHETHIGTRKSLAQLCDAPVLRDLATLLQKAISEAEAASVGCDGGGEHGLRWRRRAWAATEVESVGCDEVGERRGCDGGGERRGCDEVGERRGCDGEGGEMIGGCVSADEGNHRSSICRKRTILNCEI